MRETQYSIICVTLDMLLLCKCQLLSHKIVVVVVVKTDSLKPVEPLFVRPKFCRQRVTSCQLTLLKLCEPVPGQIFVIVSDPSKATK